MNGDIYRVTSFIAPMFASKGGEGERVERLSINDVVMILPEEGNDNTGNDEDWLHLIDITNGSLGPSGWMQRSNLEPSEAEEDGLLNFELESSTFIRECVSEAYKVNLLESTDPFYVDADYLIALAILETENGLSDTIGLDIRPGPTGERYGPFGVTKEEWSNYLDIGGRDRGYAERHLFLPIFTTAFVANQMRDNNGKLSELWRNAGVGTEENPYLPRLGESLRCRMIGVKRAFEAQKRLKDDQAGGATSLLDFLIETDESDREEEEKRTDAIGIINFYKKFMREGGKETGEPVSLSIFDKLCDDELDAQLKEALKLIKKHFPEAIPKAAETIKAPWMELAEAELAKNISESDAGTRDQIAEYFDETGTTDGDFNVPWCGAFAGWCMCQCTETPEVLEEYEKIKADAASSKAWRNWGDFSFLHKADPPKGAIVVLATTDNKSEISHVGFFVEYINKQNKRNVVILGGNQGPVNEGKISKIPFNAGNIIDIRWKNFRTAIKGAVQVTAGTHIPVNRVDTAQTIANLFAAAGYRRIQQIAAIANAVAESSLDPKARGDGGLSIGLFQCHTTAGAGIGHTPENLEDAEYNTKVIIKVANKFGRFGDTMNLDEAVAIFVKDVERPKDTAGETTKRRQIARVLKDRFGS